jgi:hypothetical protein
MPVWLTGLWAATGVCPAPPAGDEGEKLPTGHGTGVPVAACWGVLAACSAVGFGVERDLLGRRVGTGVAVSGADAGVACGLAVAWPDGAVATGVALACAGGVAGAGDGAAPAQVALALAVACRLRRSAITKRWVGWLLSRCENTVPASSL